MNPLLQILLTVALVVGGLATYHVVAADDPAGDGSGVAPIGNRDLADLEARVAALESREPLLRGSTNGGEILHGLAKRVAELEAGTPRAGAAPPDADEVATDPVESGSAAALEPTETEIDASLTKAQQKAVQRLVDSAMRERRQGRFAGRTNRILGELGIELTDDQRTKLDAAWAAHTEKVREVFASGREAGRTREDVRADLTTLNGQLAESLGSFLPAGDAESISAALTTMGRGPGGGGPPRGGPPR